MILQTLHDSAADPHGEALLTTTEVAEILRVSTATVTRLVNERSLRAFHVGPKTKRYRLSDVEAFLKASAA